MNHILNFEEYRKQIRVVESHVIQSELDGVNEGLMTKWRKYKATKIVDRVLKDEIELGKEFEQRIKMTMEELSNACEKLEGKSKKGSEFTQKINDIISEINQVSFDALSLLGDQDIDFGGFRKSVIMANVVKLGALLSPIKNGMMIKRAYNYFIGLIKQTVRKDLVMLMINFDQFQNTVMQKSLESIDNARGMQDMAQLEGEIIGNYESASKEAFKGDIHALKKLEQVQKILERQRKEKRELLKQDPVASLMQNSYDNTYKTTAENIKSLMSEDNQKQLEALKQGISKLGQGDDSLSTYGELLISSAEDKALKISNAIHSNFLKMSEVFKLTNQKKIIDLISEAEKEEQKKLKKKIKEAGEQFGIEYKEERFKFIESEFDKLKDDLRSIDLRGIDKLKDEYVKFSYKSKTVEHDEKEEKISKFQVANEYLSVNTDKLRECSDDMRMLVWVDDEDTKNYPYTYYSYIDILCDQVNKSLIKENGSSDECYIDLYKLESAEGIGNFFDRFKKGSTGRKNENRILKYINDSVIKINYKTLLEKIHELIDGLNKSDIKEAKKYMGELEELLDTKEYKEYKKRKDIYDEYMLYNRKLTSKKEATNQDEWREKIHKLINNNKELFQESDLKKEGDIYTGIKKPKNPIAPEVNLRIKVNSENYSEWKKSFEEMKKYKDNDYTKSEDK